MYKKNRQHRLNLKFSFSVMIFLINISQFTPTQKAYAVPRKNTGVPIAEIARELNPTAAAVRHYEKTQSFGRKKDSGRPDIFMERDRRSLKHNLTKYRRMLGLVYNEPLINQIKAKVICWREKLSRHG